MVKIARQIPIVPLITRKKTQSEYDVVVVGSGAAGAMTAYALAMDGVKVLMLEAGRNYTPATETPMFRTPEQAPLRGNGTPDKPFGFYDSTVDGGWQVPGEPYSSAEGTDFMWWRARMLGGRTNHWGRISLRMGPYDFKPKSRDGLGFDWPISYEDLEPWYDRVEDLIGVFGTNEGLENTPDSRNGTLQAPPAPRAYELLVQKHAKGLGVPVIPVHRAIMTQLQDPVKLVQRLHPDNPNAKYLSRHVKTRAPCFYATPCGWGCSIRANFQSTTVLIPPAVWTGNLDVMTDAMVREVTTNADGKATGVHYVDKETGEDRYAKARVVVLAASACESARILLNSKSNQFPDGVANSSGLLGKYLMDTVGAKLAGQIPAMENTPRYNEDGVSGLHMYVPWWKYSEQLAGKMDFARGYHIEFGGGQKMPSFGSMNQVPGLTGGAYGKRLKEEARRYFGSFLSFSGRGEMIPNENSFCEIDPSGAKDKFGIPTLKFHWKWSDHELKQAVHMQKTFAGIIESMGGKLQGKVAERGEDAIYRPGEIIHEVGTARMGSKKADSVLNGYCQSWDVPNLYVTDGGSFVSSPDKNCTLTILALAWRAAEHMKGELKAQNI
ncbi:MAG: choline dehydrogenase-like flavoprotein [Verrucomicrobiales bacterium]